MKSPGNKVESVSEVPSGWLKEAEYQWFCEKVPVLCVDLLPVLDRTGQFGLIERDTPTGRGLNLIGGGVLIDESIHEALLRHLQATLGAGVRLDLASLSFVGVYQYFKSPRPDELHDPRKNAVSVTFAGAITGRPQPANEAHEFHLFELDSPPMLSEFGFGQGPVVYDALASVRAGERRPYRGATLSALAHEQPN